MTDRQLVSSGTTFESVAGYSRAIKVGNTVRVAGTTATDADGNVLALGDAAEQMRITLGRIESALAEAGASLEHVVRTRTFITRAADADTIMRVHGSVFSDIRPASTLVVVAALVDPEMLVEVEVTAVI
jgi:enamine deaminase RidA (YjgF/YER057c/UK114 family)